MVDSVVAEGVVQERLGHSTIAITLDTYSHVAPGLQEAAAIRFDQCLHKSQNDVFNESPVGGNQ